ncbi:MAG: hypothetical protein IJ736_13135 [Firmicutes bacterium]|nr:hypothetical protein [Bacillota bacterium]
MACFIVPATEAIVTTAVKKIADKKAENEEGKIKNSFVRKIDWLNNMLWGGSVLLAFEHLWHGEITPWFPFLTNEVNAADRVEMFMEMATSGVGMAVLVTGIWAVMVMFTNHLEKSFELQPQKENIK